MNRFVDHSPSAVLRLSLLLLFAGCAEAQISGSAYRVLGQPDLEQRGTNIVQAVSLFTPSGIAVDARNGQVHLYIADTGNARVLAWQAINSYQIGNPPDLILGQSGPGYSVVNGIGTKGLALPVALAVDPQTGNLYVADSGDNRVVRFPSPFSNLGSAEPDTVYGQPNFTTQTANSGGISSSSMNQPQGVAFDSAGNLWVADTGNHRVLRFASGSLNSPTPPAADTVLGQKDFSSNRANAGGPVSAQGLNGPLGLAFDAQNNLYVSDFGNARVLKFAAPLGPSNTVVGAVAVFGAPNLTTGSMAGTQPSSSTLNGPAGVAVDSSGNVYVAVPADNRVMVFAATGGAALNVLGQTGFTTTRANAGTAPRASPSTLFNPADVKVDSSGNVYVADLGNNRVLQFPPNSAPNARSAVEVWGQIDFSSNAVNQIKPASLNSPDHAVIDYSQQPFALYISDTANNRVLIWKDAVGFHSGDSADLVIGQPDLRSGAANTDTQSANPSSTSLSAPTGLAVDSAGNLWVADTGNHRVLHYPRPVAQMGRITPDLVLGQSDFDSSASAVITAASLHSPIGLAVGPNGNLFVADTGNNRVLEFAAGASTDASAIRVYGQPNFNSGVAPLSISSQTLSAPRGVFVDSGFNLYVADNGANRVVYIPNTQVAATSGTPAVIAIGQSTLTSGSPGTLNSPDDVALDSSGNIYVSDTGNNRVLMFPSLLVFLTTAGTPTEVIGQSALTGTSPNWDSTNGLATPDGLFAPRGLYMDRRDTLYVSDSGNNRVLHFLRPAAVVNAAHLQAGVPIGQGGLAVLKGADLADQSAGAANTPLPASLMNRQVVFNQTITAPIFAITPAQVTFQVPSGTPVGMDQVAVSFADTGELIAGGTVPVSAVSPGLFTVSQNGTGQAAAINQDGTANGSAHPAIKGSVISLYGTGQGQVSPAVPDGAPAPASPLSATVAVPTSNGQTCLTTQPSVCVPIGNTFAPIQSSVLAPNYVGLWLINIQIPPGAPSGNAVPVLVVIDGTPSNTVTIAIQ